MGGFYGSVHLRTSNRDKVVPILLKLAGKRKHQFLLGPPLRGWVTVYPDTSGQLEKVSRAIARNFPDEVLHVLVHDDDLFCYFFYRQGKLVDRYNSRPDYFAPVSAAEEEKWRGRPDLLAGLLAADHTVDELQTLLSPETAAQTDFSVDTLEQFARLFDLPNALTSYEYLMEEERDDGGEIEAWEQFQHIPDLSRKRAQAAAQKARDQAALAQFKQNSLLLWEETRSGHAANVHPMWCTDREGSGFLIRWANMVEPEPGVLLRYDPPQKQTRALPQINLPDQIYQSTFSPSRRLFAVSTGADGGSVGVWDADTGQNIVNVRPSNHFQWFAFSADEKLVVSCSPEIGTVNSLQTGAEVASFWLCSAPGSRCQRRAFRPRRSWLRMRGRPRR